MTVSDTLQDRDRLESKAIRTDRSLLLVKLSGLCGLVIGIGVIIGWYLHWITAIQVLQNLPPMKYNTAFGFILCGCGLVLLATRHAQFASWLGGVVALLGAMTLTEYFTHRSFGIDQFFLKDYIATATAIPGRMSPLTGSCFLLLGLALAFTARDQKSKERLTAVGMLTCIVAMIACVALFGYSFGIETAYGWGAYTRMAVHTAVTFLILSMGLLIWAQYSANLIKFDFLRWLPVTGSVTLMVMISVISTVSFAQLENSTSWRKHSYEVLVTAQSFLGSIFDAQRGMRGYVLTGQPAPLSTYQAGITSAPQALDKLNSLTRDNPGQQGRVKNIIIDFNDVAAYSHKLIDARKTQGIQAAVQIEATGEGFAVINRTIADLHTFNDEEKRLLNERSAAAEADFHNTARLLIFGSGLAALLIILANLVVSREIRLRKQAMSLQEELTKKAQAAERAKSEFLAIMSHEIRTPMNGVIGMTSILSDTELSEMQRDCVSTIHSSGESLLAVINDILDYSKIEAGRLQLESNPFNLQKCVEEALDLFATQIRIKHLEAAYLVAPNVPLTLMGDAMRLRQVLVNLIGNAIKFTAQGEIVINVECREQDDSGCHLLFSVTDTGIGISKEGQEKLFQAFQQADTSTTRRYGGTGLGLVISKRLAEFMGGRMWVESEPGAGSTFFFTAILKVSEDPGLELQLSDPTLLESRSILVVDDNATNRRILETQLKIWRMVPTSVSNGHEALKILAEQKFDVALIDLQMPEMDGIVLSREICKQAHPPLILLSSSGEIIVGEEASFFQFQIPKPIKHSHLYNALLKITGVERKQPQAVQAKQFDSELAAKHPLRILLAEDNTVNQKVGLLMLSRLGYTADLALNGFQAVEAIEKAPYDLILMDIQMPEMNGIDATALVRKKLGAKCPTIFALTAEALEGDQEKFLNLGFDGYLSKPLQVPGLQDMLKTVKPVTGLE